MIIDIIYCAVALVLVALCCYLPFKSDKALPSQNKPASSEDKGQGFKFKRGSSGAGRGQYE